MANPDFHPRRPNHEIFRKVCPECGQENQIEILNEPEDNRNWSYNCANCRADLGEVHAVFAPTVTTVAAEDEE